MRRRLLVLNVVLGIVSVAFAVGIVRTLLARHPMPVAPAGRPAPAPQSAATAVGAELGPEAYGVIAAQNLFNPARSQTATAAAVAVVKPILHGIVMDGLKSRAFLEDPTVKRVSGYSVGDSVSGGEIQKIADDRVVIARPDGMVEVLLRDPSKPRPAPVPAVAAAPGQVAPGQPAPGQPTPGQPAPGQAAPAPVSPPPSGPVVNPFARPPDQPASAVPPLGRRVRQ
jgi:preprotein translocase subunit SecD